MRLMLTCLIRPKAMTRPLLAMLSLVIALGMSIGSSASAQSRLEFQSTPAPQTDRSPAAAAPSREPVTKAQVIARLRELQARQLQIIGNIDLMIRKKLVETTSLSLRGQDGKDADRKLELVSQSLEELQSRRAEFAARRAFLDQLIFHLDTRWANEPLQSLLEHRLLDMAVSDLSDTKPGDTHDPQLWKFMTYLSVATRELADSREDLLGFVEGYMNFSSVLDPKPPSQYIASRAYSSGTLGAAAKPVDADHLGDEVDRRLKALQASKTKQSDTKSVSASTEPIEIRVRTSEVAPSAHQPTDATASPATGPAASRN